MKFARLGFCLTLLTLGLAACGPQVPPVGNYATVFGTVTDAANNAPIANAIVTINSVQSATTDASGNYRITSVPTGPWSYTVSAPSYQPSANSAAAPLGPGEQRNYPIQLTHA